MSYHTCYLVPPVTPYRAMPSSCWVIVHKNMRKFLTEWDTDGTHSEWLSHPEIGEELIVLGSDDMGWTSVISKEAWLAKRASTKPRWIHPAVVKPVRHDHLVYTLAEETYPEEPQLPCFSLLNMMRTYAAPSREDKKHLGRCIHCTNRMWQTYRDECNHALDWTLRRIMNERTSVNLRCRRGRHRTTCIANAAMSITGARWVPHERMQMCQVDLECKIAERAEVLSLSEYRAVADIEPIQQLVERLRLVQQYRR